VIFLCRNKLSGFLYLRCAQGREADLFGSFFFDFWQNIKKLKKLLTKSREFENSTKIVIYNFANMAAYQTVKKVSRARALPPTGYTAAAFAASLYVGVMYALYLYELSDVRMPKGYCCKN